MISYVLLFYPVMITFMVVSFDATLHSIDTGERSQESVWRAIMWPFRASIPLAAVLLMIQGISEVLKCWYQIQFGREFVHKEKIEI
jgi:TRAP-type mannitol/chloroaromatic compound transport system permease small subunit